MESKDEIRRRLEKSKEYKKRIQGLAHDLFVQYKTGKITYYEYQDKLRENFDNKSVREWIEHYDKHISIYEKYLRASSSVLAKERKKSFVKTGLFILGALFLVSVFIGIYFFSSTGDIFLAPAINVRFTDVVDFTFESSGLQEREWIPENKGELSGVRISGTITGSLEDEAKVFLISPEGVEIPIFEFSALDVVSLSPELGGNVTGNETIVSNITTNITDINITDVNVTDNESIQDIIPENVFSFDFNGLCEDTCDLSGLGFVSDSYTLKVEIQGESLVLEIKEIVYDIVLEVPEEVSEEEVRVVEEKKIEKDEFKAKAKKDFDKRSRGKKVVVSGPETAVNVPVTIDISDISLGDTVVKKGDEKRINVYWVDQDVFINHDEIIFEDSDGDGNIDSVEFNVAHFSNQTFEIIIEITKAEHLNASRNFVSDIFLEVFTLDGIWSESIPSEDYVRVRFEKNLTAENDITIYPRIVSGTPTIEVYEQGSDLVIAQFDNIVENEYNKIFLTSLVGSQDTFDLRVSGGSVEFDHIIDPSTFEQEFFENCASISDWTRTSTGESSNWGIKNSACEVYAHNGVATMINTIPISLSAGITRSRLSFSWWQGDSPLSFDVWSSSNGGSSWSLFWSWRRDPGGLVDLPLPQSYIGSNQVKIRVRCQSDGIGGLNFGKFCRIDNINVTSETVINDPPVVTNIEDIGTASIIENGVRNVQFDVFVSDPNGFNNIDTVSATFSKGVVTRTDSSCIFSSGGGNNAVYSCTIGIQYFDDPGLWDVSATVEDFGGLSDSRNEAENFNLGGTISIQIGGVSWTSLTPGDTNVEAEEEVVVNNTGNVEIDGLYDRKITAYDLKGADATIFPSNSFSVSEDGFCVASPPLLDNGVPRDVNIILSVGNHSVNDGVTAQDQLYFCAESVPSLPAQSYSTANNVPWDITITILFVPFVVTRRRKKKKKIKLLEELSELVEEPKIKDKLKEVLALIKKEEEKERKEIEIPISIFSLKLSPAEALCKYLKENEGLRFNEIAKLIKRDQRTVWINYRNSNEKDKRKISIVKEKIYVPIVIFSDRRLSLLEALVKHLRDKGLRNVEVARALDKHPNNTVTLRARAKDKLKMIKTK